MQSGQKAKVDDILAARQLTGQRVASFETDVLAIDGAGRIAIFLGEDAAPVPSRGKVRSAADVEERIFTEAHETRERAGEATYRSAADHRAEVVHDVPAGHERPLDGYPQLVVSSEDGARDVRQALETWGGREVLSRAGFAVALDVVGAITFEELHATGACAGCRNLDDPTDPQLRSPEMLAAGGLYVYRASPDRTWRRLVSPGVPARREDFPGADLLELAVSFEDASSLRAWGAR